jgi:hypothetical protein
MESNLLLQAPGNIVPYATAGVGFIASWGKDNQEDSVPEEIAADAFNLGCSNRDSARFQKRRGGGYTDVPLAGGRLHDCQA